MQPQCLPCLPVELQDTQVQHSWPPPNACDTAVRVWLSSTWAGSLAASRSALLKAVLVQFSAMATSTKGSTLHGSSADSEDPDACRHTRCWASAVTQTVGSTLCSSSMKDPKG